jgi:hypothetical protein
MSEKEKEKEGTETKKADPVRKAKLKNLLKEPGLTDQAKEEIEKAIKEC